MTIEAADSWSRAVRALHTSQAHIEDDPDSAASRAYYAAFHAVSALFLLQGKEFHKHSALEAAVHRDLVKTGKWPKEVGSDFSWLASLRQTGDYGGAEHVSCEDAREAIVKSRNILSHVHMEAPSVFAFSLPD